MVLKWGTCGVHLKGILLHRTKFQLCSILFHQMGIFAPIFPELLLLRKKNYFNKLKLYFANIYHTKAVEFESLKIFPLQSLFSFLISELSIAAVTFTYIDFL